MHQECRQHRWEEPDWRRGDRDSCWPEPRTDTCHHHREKEQIDSDEKSREPDRGTGGSHDNLAATPWQGSDLDPHRRSRQRVCLPWKSGQCSRVWLLFCPPILILGARTKREYHGWIRQFFAKESRFEEITQRSVKRVKGLLNGRPRKSLPLATPTEAFFGKSFGENFAFQGWIRQFNFYSKYCWLKNWACKCDF